MKTLLFLLFQIVVIGLVAWHGERQALIVTILILNSMVLWIVHDWVGKQTNINHDNFTVVFRLLENLKTTLKYLDSTLDEQKTALGDLATTVDEALDEVRDELSGVSTTLDEQKTALDEVRDELSGVESAVSSL